MSLITRAQLAKVAPHAAAHIVTAIVDHADVVLIRYGLATTSRMIDFLAHVLVESAYLTRVHENLSYSAERLHAVWPTRFPSVASAEPFARDPRALANHVYGGRMGNTGPDDGWLNRGQGLIATTGHDNIARLAAHMHLSLEAARTMLTADAGMLEAAAATYVMLGAPAYADKGDIVGSTRAINGGINGLADRRAMKALCSKIWPRGVAPAAAMTPIPTPLKKKVPPMSKVTWFSVLLAAFGLSTTGAHAGSIDITPVLSSGVDSLVVPLLAATVPLISSLLVMPLRRYLDQRTADMLAGRVNDLLDKAIGFAAKQAEGWIGRQDFHVEVDGWITGIAAEYARDHAPALLQQAGGSLTQKLQARIASHVDVLALKATAAVSESLPGAPLDLTPAIAKAA